jgi:hypothetical protein
MKKTKRCKGCGNKKYEEILCDTCVRILPYPIILLIIRDTDYDFCELKCLLKFVIAANNWETPKYLQQ